MDKYINEINQELEGLSNNQKEELLQKLLKQKRVELCATIACKNATMKSNAVDQLEEQRKKISIIKKQVQALQSIKDNLQSQPKKEKSKKIKPSNEMETFSLSPSESELLQTFSSENHQMLLTTFDEKTPLLEQIEVLKEKYISYMKKENKILKKIRKTMALLSEESTDFKILEQQKKECLAKRKVLKKVLLYLNNLIHLEYKKNNRMQRIEQRMMNTAFAEKYGMILEEEPEDYTVQELFTLYYELVFKDKDIETINDLLDQFPDLYTLKNKKRLLYEDILDKFSNIVLNKSYMRDDKKSCANLEELEYYKALILKYLSYSFDYSNTFITEITIKKMERILSLLHKSDIYSDKSNVIIQNVAYINDWIRYGTSLDDKKDDIKEVKGEYIFSIDTEGTKVIEDAISIQKVDNDYYVHIYTPDVVSFVEISSVQEKRCLERYKCSRDNRYIFTYNELSFFHLLQGRKKRTIGYHFLLDENGNLKDLKVQKHITKLYNRYSFEEFNQLLIEGQDKNANLLQELCSILEHKNRGDVTSSINILRTLILHMGSMLGKYLNARGIPGIYKNLKDGMVYTFPNPDEYVEFTSPLRSSISFLNQRILVDQYVSNGLKEYCMELNREKEKKCKVKIGEGSYYENK